MTNDRPRAFLDISIGTAPAGRLVFELFTDKTPRTCNNFLTLCNATHNDLTYATSPFHRVIDEFMIQGGDITNGDGTGGDSIFGGEFEDENLEWREMDAKGLLCMANRGKDTNSSQFFITLEPCPHLNGKHTVFGRIVGGQDVVDKIAKVDVDRDDRPREPILISRCGELQRRKPQAKVEKRSDEREAEASDRDRRGRKSRRASGSESESGSGSPSQSRSRSRSVTRKRRRRDSDAVVDENLRGRVKRRSRSRDHRSSSNSKSQNEKQTTPRDEQGDVKESKRRRSGSRSRRDDKIHDSRKRSRSRSGTRYDRRRDYGERHEERRRDYDDRRDGPRSRPRNDRRDRGQARISDRDRHWRSQDNRGGQRYHDRDYSSRPPRRDEGRLGGDNEEGGSNDSGIVFKGRGSMKYREPEQRRW